MTPITLASGAVWRSTKLSAPALKPVMTSKWKKLEALAELGAVVLHRPPHRGVLGVVVDDDDFEVRDSRAPPANSSVWITIAGGSLQIATCSETLGQTRSAGWRAIISAAGRASRGQRRRQIVSTISSACTSAMTRLITRKKASMLQPTISATTM